MQQVVLLAVVLSKMSYHQSKTSILSSLDKDYIEEGRRDIYKWGETRSRRRKGIRGWAYAFKKMFIDKWVSFNSL